MVLPFAFIYMPLSTPLYEDAYTVEWPFYHSADKKKERERKIDIW